MKNAPRILILHYVLMAYVALQFVWWAWLIYDLNVDLLEAEASNLGEPVSKGDVNAKLWMLIGEGSVFFVLLSVGAIYIRQFIMREHRLARQEKNFLLATTHEFNSPIAAIKLNLQTLIRKGLKDEQRAQVIDGALHATSRLQGLVSNLLMASRIEAGKYAIHREPTDIDELLRRIKAAFDPLATEAGNQLEVDSQLGETIKVDRASLEFILSNLVTNALKYAPSTVVSMRAEPMDGVLQISVSDCGSGIPLEERERIFRKFYRIGSEETRSKKGTGLGLFLVRELATMQGGSVSIAENSQGKGASFNVLIPYE